MKSIVVFTVNHTGRIISPMTNMKLFGIRLAMRNAKALYLKILPDYQTGPRLLLLSSAR